MGYLSNQTNGSRDAEIIELKTKLNGLQTAMVGMETMFPPTAIDGSIDPSWVPKNGQTLSRAAYPALWERVKNMGTYVTDSAWLALQSSSPNGAVSLYSSGDGSTTFRVPTVGEDGGFQRAIGTDPILNALRDSTVGFQDQIQNITGSAGSLTNENITLGSARGSAVDITNGAIRYQTGSVTISDVDWINRDGYAVSIDFDASRVARTGDETYPKGMFGKVYIYSGNSTTSLPTPTVDWLAQQYTNTAKIAEHDAEINLSRVAYSRNVANLVGDANGIIFTRVGNEVKVSWKVATAIAVANNTPLVNIPDGYKPVSTQAYTEFGSTHIAASGGALIRWILNSSNQLYCYDWAATTATPRFNASWLTTDAYPTGDEI